MATKVETQSEKFPMLVVGQKLMKPMILREHVGEIDHPKHGKVQISRGMGAGSTIFEFPDGNYYVFGLRDLADALFGMLDE